MSGSATIATNCDACDACDAFTADQNRKCRHRGVAGVGRVAKFDSLQRAFISSIGKPNPLKTRLFISGQTFFAKPTEIEYDGVSYE